MRECGTTPEFLTKNANLFAVVLPADYCAEHEWGITELRQAFGIPKREITKGPFGLERYIAKKVPDDLLWEHTEDECYLAVSPYHQERSLAETKKEFTRFLGTNHIGGAWDERSFGIFADTKQQLHKLDQIQKAIFDQNVAIFLGGGNIFENSGLIIAIADKVPYEHRAAMRKTQEESAKLYQAASDTGIHKKLEEANCRYYALSPKWKRDESTKYPVVFWLNPMEQDKHNYGHYTVEDLLTWSQGQGPIIKRAS